jgi:uncharacterized protein
MCVPEGVSFERSDRGFAQLASRRRLRLEVPMLMLLVSAALAAASPAAPATPGAAAAEAPADATPAMFIVRDADTTIYLFGTFHALDGHSLWFDHAVKDAFDRASELVLETLPPERPAAAAAPSGQPRPAFRDWSIAASASFLETTRLAISAGRARGMQVDNGADMVLRRAAERAGKDVAGLETIDSQLRMLSRMPDAQLPALPRPGDPVGRGATLSDLSDSMVELQTAWKRGEQHLFTRMLDQLRQTSPAIYRSMFAERNARWADWVRARLDRPGTVFVAVGAGHLAGCDSLLVRLAEMGTVSARVAPAAPAGPRELAIEPALD